MAEINLPSSSSGDSSQKKVSSSPASPSSHKRSSSTNAAFSASNFVDMFSQKTSDLFSLKKSKKKGGQSSRPSSHNVTASSPSKEAKEDKVGQLYHLGNFSRQLAEDNENLRVELNKTLEKLQRVTTEKNLAESKVDALQESVNSLTEKLQQQGDTMLLEVNNISETAKKLQCENDILQQDRQALLEVFNSQQKKIYLLEEKVAMYKAAVDEEVTANINKAVEDIEEALSQTNITLEMDRAPSGVFSGSSFDTTETFEENADWEQPPSDMQEFKKQETSWEDRWSDDDEPAHSTVKEAHGSRSVDKDGYMEQPDLASEFKDFLQAATMSNNLKLKVCARRWDLLLIGSGCDQDRRRNQRSR